MSKETVNVNILVTSKNGGKTKQAEFWLVLNSKSPFLPHFRMSPRLDEVQQTTLPVATDEMCLVSATIMGDQKNMP